MTAPADKVREALELLMTAANRPGTMTGERADEIEDELLAALDALEQEAEQLRVEKDLADYDRIDLAARLREAEEALREVVRYFDSYGMPPAGFPLAMCRAALAASPPWNYPPNPELHHEFDPSPE